MWKKNTKVYDLYAISQNRQIYDNKNPSKRKSNNIELRSNNIKLQFNIETQRAMDKVRKLECH